MAEKGHPENCPHCGSDGPNRKGYSLLSAPSADFSVAAEGGAQLKESYVSAKARLTFPFKE